MTAVSCDEIARLHADRAACARLASVAGARLRRYFEGYALNTAGIVTERTLLESAGVDRRTALAYERLLTNLLVI